MSLPFHSFFLRLRYGLCIGLISLIACNADSITPSSAFIKVFGGAKQQEGIDILAAEDQGFYLLGSTTSFRGSGDSSMYLVRVGEDGNELWSKIFDQGDRSVGRSMVRTADGSFLIAGETTTDNQSDMLLLRVDQEGALLSEQEIGYPTSNEQLSEIVAVPGEDTYLLVGSTTNVDDIKAGSEEGDTHDIFLVKVDASGNEIWRRRYGNLGRDVGNAVLALSADSIAVLGTTDFSEEAGRAQQNLRLLLLNGDGRLLDARTYGGSGSQLGSDLLVAEAGGLLLVGTQQSPSDTAIYLVKTTTDLAIDQARTLRGSEGAFIADAGAEGGYFLVGNTLEENTDQNFLLLRLDANLNEIWSESYGGAGFDRAARMAFAKDGGVVLVGTLGFGNNTMLGMIKTNARGELDIF